MKWLRCPVQKGIPAIFIGVSLEIEVIDLALENMPKPPVKITMNVGNPDLAFGFQRIPNDGVGLARLEFIIARMIGIHPNAVLHYPDLPADLKQQVENQSAGYPDPVSFYVEKLAEGIATLGAAFFPKPVIVRLSDFKSNEYSSLIGGQQYEPREENPMLGFRGASRYVAKDFRDCFELECRAMKKARDRYGAYQSGDHDSVCADGDRSQARSKPAGGKRLETGRERPAADHDV